MKVNPIKAFFESKPVQKFYKKVCDPKHAGFFNNTLPTIETGVSTLLYCWATAKQKDIPSEQKAVLQWQNILGGIAGIIVGTALNRKVSKFANELAPKIDKKIVDIHKVEAGIKIGAPLAATCLLMRCISPTVVAQVSTMIEDYRREKKNKLDVKA
jgi:hypothetical protein